MHKEIEPNNYDKGNKENKNNKKNELSNPHDATFKKLFGQVEIAKDVIEKNLPKEIINDMDLDTIERLDGSFISEKLKETFSDIIYGIKINNKDVYIALLLEHKSYKDKLTIFQVSRYIIDLWSKTIESGKEELPIVIPIVVYHGKGQWYYKKDTREMIPEYNKLPKYLKERLPVLKHDFIDIRKQDEQEIKEYNPLTRMVIRSFKYIFDDKDKLLEYLLISIEETGEDITEELYRVLEIILIYYSATNKDITEEDILNKIRELEGKGGKIMTVLQAREQKGIEKGIERGIEKGIEKGIERGMKEGAKESLVKMNIRLLTKKFGSLSDEFKTRLSSLEVVELEAIADNIFEYKTIDDVEKYIK